MGINTIKNITSMTTQSVVIRFTLVIAIIVYRHGALDGVVGGSPFFVQFTAIGFLSVTFNGNITICTSFGK